jgi:hypothetical protein
VPLDQSNNNCAWGHVKTEDDRRRWFAHHLRTIFLPRALAYPRCLFVVTSE